MAGSPRKPLAKLSAGGLTVLKDVGPRVPGPVAASVAAPGQTIAVAPPPPAVMLTTTSTVLVTPPPRLIYVDDKPCTSVQKGALVVADGMPGQVRVDGQHLLCLSRWETRRNSIDGAAIALILFVRALGSRYIFTSLSIYL